MSAFKGIDIDRSELENLSVLTEVLKNTSVYRLPSRSLGLLENMAEDMESSTGGLARNILRSNGYYFAPIIQLPQAIVATAKSSGAEVAKASSQFQLYPNPTNGLFTTYWGTDFAPSGTGQLLIRDATGRLIFQQEIRPFERRIHDLSTHGKGVYFYEVRSGGQKPIVGKILIH